MEVRSFYLFIILFFFFSLTLIYGQDSGSLTAEALTDFQQNNNEAAIAKLISVLEKDEFFIEARILLGQIYIQENNPELAEETLRPVLTLRATNPELHFVLGIALFEQGKYQSSLNEMERVLKLDPSNEKAKEVLSLCYLNLGVAEYNNGSLIDAKKRFIKSIELNNRNIKTYQNLTIVLFELGDRERVIEIANDGLNISPKDRSILNILAQTYLESNMIEKALKPAQDFYDYYPNDIDGALRLAYICRFLGKGDDALKIYSDLIEKYPSDKVIYDQYVDLLVIRNKYDEAIDLYERLLLFAENKTDIHQKIAEVHLKEKNYEAARSSYRNALKYNSNTELIYNKIALTFLDQHNVEAAIKTYREGLSEHPSSIQLLFKLAGLFENINIDSATAIYQHIEILVPENPAPPIRLAKIYEKVDPEFSKNYCNRAIELNTENPYPYFIVAGFELNEMDTSNSILFFNQSVKKSLIGISKVKKLFLNKITKAKGRISPDKFNNLEDDATELEYMQILLRNSLESIMNLANIYQFEISLRTWSKEYPEETILKEYLGKIMEKNNRGADALSIYEELIRSNPKEISGHMGYARVKEKEGEYDEAILAYKRALTIESKNSELYHKLISLGKIRKKTKQLCEEWLIRVKREPENKVLLTNLRALLKLEGKEEKLKKISDMIIAIDKNK